MRETDIRLGQFGYKGTLITEAGELDVFLAENTGARIHVTMSKMIDNPSELVFASVHFGRFAEQADDLYIVDDAGQSLSADAIEALAFEMIEDSSARLMEYAYGRPAARLSTGEPTIPGETVINLAERDEAVLAQYLEDPEPAGMM